MMKSEYVCEPKRQGKGAACLVLLSALLAIGLWSAGSYAPLRVLWQLGAVVCLTATIMLITRYLVRRYIYTFYRDGERAASAEYTERQCWAFKVTEVQSRRRRLVVCHLDATDILAFRPVDRSDRAALAAAKNEASGLKVYNYCVDIRPRRFCQMIIQNGDERLCVRFTPDDEMINAIEETQGGTF